MSNKDNSSNSFLEMECTLRCHSHEHASQILAAVTKGDNSEIQAYSRWLCYNFFNITDKLGRNILHMAAACGKWKLVEWLLKNCHADVDVKDKESGWTALHRSLFYGQITVARKLLTYGANLHITDHEGLTPLDIIMKDRLPYIEYSKCDLAEVYVWGSNANFNLGLGNDQNREQPELLDTFRRENINIKQVVMCKFHSVFLSNDGHVFTCGHGLGGRLGQNSEEAVLVPTPVKGIKSLVCQEIAAGEDHLVMLMENGQVWTCGLNTYHQLGHVPPPERLLLPRPISLKLIKSQEFIGVCAARYHTVLYTKKAVFTFGLNAGQLGHPKGEKTQVSPKQVSSLDHEENVITNVVASDGATVCATTKGDIYVLHEYQCRKIASKQLEIQKVSVVGGHLNAVCQIENVKEGGASELRIIILTKSGKVFIWRELYPQLRRCLFNMRRQLIITDVQITQNNVLLTTYDGEGFIGHIIPPRSNQNNASSTQVVGKKKSLMVTSLNTLLNREDCDLMHLKRLRGIYRATQITSDSKGRNCAVLQCHPKMSLTELPSLPPSKIEENFLQLFQDSHQNDDVHDVTLHVNGSPFIGHKFVLASRSEYFKKCFLTDSGTKNVHQNLTVENITYDVFEQILWFIYSNNCDFLKEGKEIKWKHFSTDSNSLNIDDFMAKPLRGVSAYEVAHEKSKIKQSKKTKKETENPLSEVREASKRCGIPSLSERLKGIKLTGGKIKIIDQSPLPLLKFDRLTFTNLCDISLVSEDKVKFECHRCVLIARSEYFHSMLSSGWIETSSAKPLNLPIKSKILEIVLDYLYTDSAPKVFYADPEFLCDVLVVADHILLDKLKAICEQALVEMITLRNATELLELSYVYNATQLKATCMQYICLNLSSIIENESLNILSDDIMEEITHYYRTLLPGMSKRVVTPYSEGPTREEMLVIAEQYPIDDKSDLVLPSMESLVIKSSEVKTKGRNRSHSYRGNSDENKLPRERRNSENAKMNLENKSPSPASSNIISSSKPTNNIPEKQVPIAKKGNDHDCSITVNKQFVKSGWCTPEQKEVPLLDDIMKEEQVAQNFLRKANHKQEHVQANLSWNLKPTASPVGKAWPTVSTTNDKDNLCWNRKCTTNETTIQVSPANDKVSLCWNRKFTTNETAIPNFIDIIKAEEQEETLMQLPKAKPLHLINLEDEAIEELLKLYDAKDNFDECISVTRLLPERKGAPVWKRHSASSP